MALTLLDEHDERQSLAEDALRAKIEEGVEAARRGDYADYTDETLPRLVEDVVTRARERAGLREGWRA